MFASILRLFRSEEALPTSPSCTVWCLMFELLVSSISSWSSSKLLLQSAARYPEQRWSGFRASLPALAEKDREEFGVLLPRFAPPPGPLARLLREIDDSNWEASRPEVGDFLREAPPVW